MNWCAVFALFFSVLYVLDGFPIDIFPEMGRGRLYQGDMIFTVDQMELAEKGGDLAMTEETKKKHGRPQFGKAAAGAFTLRWKDARVPYVISSKAKCYAFLCWWGKMARPGKAIEEAMEEIEKHTCIRFMEKTDKDRDYLYFTNDGWSKCFSYVGRIGGKQEISLTNGCSSKGIAMHEILHALGMHHEQSRADRDKYVTINLQNVDDRQIRNFDKYSMSTIKTFDTPYDYSSIMHYADTAFSKNGFAKTIVTKGNQDIGQRERLSKYDVLALNKLYNCK